MKKRWSLVLMVCALVFVTPMADVNSAVLLDQNFENYSLGSTVPELYGWWGGWSVAQESGNKFYRSVDGEYCGADLLMQTSQTFTGNVLIEFDSRKVNCNDYFDVTLANSLNNIPGQWSITFYYFESWYSFSGEFRALYGYFDLDGVPHYDGSYHVFGYGQFDLRDWRKIKIELVDGVAAFYMDNVFIGEFDIASVIPLPIENFFISWQTWGTRDLDNIKVSTFVSTHTINSTAASNGNISPSGPVSVDNKGNQTFVINPDTSCYKIADVLVDGGSVGAVSSYTFNNVSADHTITALFAINDTTPPSINTASVNPFALWPPNNKMVDVAVDYNVTDNCGQSTCKISSITSNEPISNSDYAIVDTKHVKLRADRSGKGNGRIYSITITCTDLYGNSSNQAVAVTVPHDQGKK